MSKRNNIVYIYILIHQTVCVVLLKYFENKNYERTRVHFRTNAYKKITKNNISLVYFFVSYQKFTQNLQIL